MTPNGVLFFLTASCHRHCDCHKSSISFFLHRMTIGNVQPWKAKLQHATCEQMTLTMHTIRVVLHR